MDKQMSTRGIVPQFISGELSGVRMSLEITGGTVKGTRSRQHMCLRSLTFKQGQVGKAAACSRIRRFTSSLLNLSWVFFLNKPVKTHSWQSHCALYTRVRAFVRHSQSFPRICRSHFRKDLHFMGFFFKPPYEANTKGVPSACYRQ